MTDDARLDYPATQRNREPILAVLKELLPPRGTVLEVASGSGQHAEFFASALPEITWQPSDHDGEVLPSIRAWTEALTNVLEPVRIDASSPQWPDPFKSSPIHAIYCANMIHIAPWEACLGLLRGAGQLLGEDAPLIFYGPFMRGGEHSAPSNAAFDARLKSQDSSWGVRDLETITEHARASGLEMDRLVEMPANNAIVVFRSTSS